VYVLTLCVLSLEFGLLIGLTRLLAFTLMSRLQVHRWPSFVGLDGLVHC